MEATTLAARIQLEAVSAWEPLEAGPKATLKALRALRPPAPQGYQRGQRLVHILEARLQVVIQPLDGIGALNPSATLATYRGQTNEQLVAVVQNEVMPHGRTNDVRLVYRSMGQHIHHTAHLKPMAALAALAGMYRHPEVFRDVLFLQPSAADDVDVDPDVEMLAKKLKHRSFCDAHTLQLAVHHAVAMAVCAQSAGATRSANPYLSRAQRLVATHLQSLEGNFQAGAEGTFRTITSHLGVAADALRNSGYTLYTGILTGLCIASAMRFCENELASGKKHADRFVVAVGALSVGVGAIPFAGAPLASLFTDFAPSIAERLFKKEDFRPALFQLGAAIEDRIYAQPGRVNPIEFARQLEKTMRHCGYAY